MIRDYQALKAFTDHVGGAYLAIGSTISMDEGRGASLCRQGLLKDVTARVADTDVERIEDLEATAVDHETRIDYLYTTLGY